LIFSDRERTNQLPRIFQKARADSHSAKRSSGLASALEKIGELSKTSGNMRDQFRKIWEETMEKSSVRRLLAKAASLGQNLNE